MSWSQDNFKVKNKKKKTKQILEVPLPTSWRIFKSQQVYRNDVYLLQPARMVFFVVPNSYMELFGVPYITDISPCAPFYFFDGPETKMADGYH